MSKLTFDLVLSVIIMTIPMIDSMSTDEVVDMIENLYDYNDLDLYDNIGSESVKDLFVHFVKKFKKNYFSEEEIQLRYELFKLKMLRDGYRDDKTLDMTDKEIKVSTSKTVSINERVDKTATTATTNKTVEHGTPNKQQTTATGNIGNKSVEFPPHTAKGESDMETDSNKFPLKSTNNTIQMIFINSAVSFKTHGGLTLNSNNPEKDESQNNFKGLKFYERNTSRRTTNDVPANCTEIVRCDCTDMKTTSHGINFHQVKEVPTFIMRKKEGATKIEENQQTATKATVDIHSIETTTVPDNTSHITEPTTESTKVTDNTTHVTDPTTKTTTVTESTTEPTKVTKNTTHTTEPTTQTTTLTDTLRKIFSMHQSLKIKVSYHRS
ncbi:hypothetical protein M8J76_002179 [Diaphorina citri]|nr:hypothetical protein M8J75_012637 [Diaphorina citri]KAI5732604.1 hypothetical protein M8J76_002179 [Diaphorina citri]